jgi:hypothetical protein
MRGLAVALTLAGLMLAPEIALAQEAVAAPPGVPAAVPTSSWPRTAAIYGAVYGSLYTVAFAASNVASFTIMSLASPAWLPVAMSFGMPAVMVGVMSQAVPKVIEAVPPAMVRLLDGEPSAPD